MFVVLLHYKQPVEKIEQALEAHCRFLEDGFAKKKFIAAGRKKPRTGGVILCQADTQQEVETLLANDPFQTQNLADYEIIEFEANCYNNDWQPFPKA